MSGGHIRGHGLQNENVFHAIPVEPDYWHAVDCERTGGVSQYTREMLITRLADLIGAGKIYSLDIDGERVFIDRAGNIWRDHEYLSPHQYLPELVKP